jgi:hypothetical protein
VYIRVSDYESPRRREFLLSATVGGTALLAGCLNSDSTDDGTTVNNDDSDNGTDNSSDDGTDEGSDDGTDDGSDDGADDGSDDGTDEGSDDGTDDGSSDEEEPAEPGPDERQVGLVAALGQEEQQTLQQLQFQLRQGQITESEFDEQIQGVLGPVLEDLTGVIESEAGGTVVEQLTLIGAVRVNGTPEALLDAVERSDVDALVASNDLDTGGS